MKLTEEEFSKVVHEVAGIILSTPLPYAETGDSRRGYAVLVEHYLKEYIQDYIEQYQRENPPFSGPYK